MQNQMTIKHVCFDLDGTLINSFDTILESTLKALDHLEIENSIDEKEFYNRIGLHFEDIFNELNVSVPDVEHFIKVFKGYYFDFIDKSEMYPNVIETIKYLNENNISVTLLTTKAQDQADKIIDLFGLRPYFKFVMGRRVGLEIKPSPEPLLFICNDLKILPENTLMVGDSELDIRCGKSAGTYTAAAAYGYRSEEVIAAENPDFTLSNIKELIAIVKV